MKYNYYDGNKIVIYGKAVPGQTLAWGETKMLTADKIQSVNTTDYWGNVLYENSGLQRYKFNGKELDLVHGLRLYDYGARMYDQILGCWTSVDPMAEKYYHISPYVFCFDIPVRMVDRDGKDPWDLPMMLRPQEEQKILRLNNKTYE